jgi:hypothetical protein
MKKGGTFILKGAIVLLGIAVLALCIFVLPAGLASGVGYYTPVIIGMYIAAIPFYFGLYEAFRLLNLIDRNNAFSAASAASLKKIKYCATAISCLYIALLPLIFNAADKDDAPGVIVIGLVIVFASATVGVFAGVLEKLMRNAIEMKSENDLTV